ncbi:stalk domain-containing protein [Maledivibacter halophilus]|uniref:LysM domain-containing protein n=1 Tax=Maledivibacter halophilus TaxID=36842 RepID=A0A1T5J487_9FIRM|nr:stalk domain-containing protein [Maledivibacter halophilus]SKC46259.1 LysM domain-containing protein [Maledivibacter halophilus]
MKKFICSMLIASTFLISPISHAESFVMHTAKAGDSYSYISNEFNVNIDTLKELNQDKDNIISEGSLVKIKPISMNKTITIKVNNEKLNPEQHPYIENNRAFVPIRTIANALNADGIIWEDSSKTAILVQDKKTIRLTLGSNIAKINDQDVKLDAPISVYEGRTYVPIRFISEAFDCNVAWDNDNKTVLVNTTDSYDEDLYWLSRIIHAEATTQPLEGKIAVGNVIINRKNSPNFPNTIKEVIFDTNYGYQYTPAKNGAIHNSPSTESIKAAKLVLNGKNNISGCLYFLNPRKSTNNWIVKNKTFYKRIGAHDFYR